MGSKRNKSKTFGKSTGAHQSKRKHHTGRPTYTISVARPSNKRCPTKVIIKVKKVHKKKTFKRPLSAPQKRQLYSVYKYAGNLKLKFKKLSDPCGNGYRVINLTKLKDHVSELTMHAAQCPKAISLAAKGKSPITLVSEVRTIGLVSVLEAQCKGCSLKFTFETSPKLPSRKRYDINVRAVWGSIVTGNGPSHLNEFMATLDSPGLSQVSFSAIEEEIGEWWRNVLEQEMLLAGAEERQKAIERGDFFGEVPSVTVITDGGWSKRTHKHSYNALGGVAIIIGKETKKLLHIGVRNKYCYICNSAESRKVEPKQHKCFRNWNDSSQSMEANIIVEGFKEAESKHGIRYMRVVGDGDSSVFAKIREEVPVWGRYVTKIECSNHVCKCLRSKLEKLVAENPMYKGKHNLSKATRVRIVSAVRCAIRVRSKEAVANRQTAVTKLRHDIRNCVHHIFGYHDNCSDFCKAKSSSNASATEPVNLDPKDTITDEVADVMDEQVGLWTDGTSVTAQDESRLGSCHNYSQVEQFIIADVLSILSPVADKSDRLLGNTTTNLAESWMHIRSKFDGGKIFHICNRGSWHGRCYGGALRMNLGPQWAPKVWKTVTATEPGHHFKKLYCRRETLLENSVRHKSKPESSARRWKRKMSGIQQSNRKKARQDYGPEALDVTEDVTEDQLTDKKNTFRQKNVDVSDAMVDSIEKATHTQSQSGLWHTERKKRLTASNFGPIVRRNPSIPVKVLVKKLLYNNFKGTRHTRNGLLQEHNTIEEYKLKKAEQGENVVVRNTGLIINRRHKFLAGSPDGIVELDSGDKGLIEVKNLLHEQPINLWEAAASKPTFCLKVVDGTLELKENHDYFYQCHGLMNVCGYPWIDFVVRTMNPYQIHIQRILRDDKYWSNVMFPKLLSFFDKAVLPELACPREGKSPGIREPGIWHVSTQGTSVKKTRQKRLSGTAASRKRKGQIKSRKQPVAPISSTQKTPKPSTSTVCVRSKRQTSGVKFVGRGIRHQWIIDESKHQRQWFTGSVLSVVSGRDGQPGAVHQVSYDGETEIYEVDHLLDDYLCSSLTFADV